jgi:apolipoprotein D and lipocalin family protein
MNSFKFIVSLIIFTSLLSCTLSAAGFGKCSVKPTPQVVQNFDITKYTGKWFEQYRDKQFLFSSGECVTAEYTLNADGKSVKVNNSELRSNGERKGAIGKAVCPTSEAKCTVTFDESIFSRLSKGNYWVYDTDYENYSIVYSCSEYLSIFYAEFVWVLTRQATPSKEVLEKANEAIDRLGYPRENLRTRTVQGDGCKY